jgi:vancomycin resistance protein YoaR
MTGNRIGPNRRKWWASAACVATAAAALAAVGVLVDSSQFARSQRIAPNVTIGGLPVGGKTVEEATRDVASALSPILDRTLVLRNGSRRWQVAPAELGARLGVEESVARAYAVARSGSTGQRLAERVRLVRRPLDIPIEVAVDEGKLQAWVRGLAREVDVSPRNATASVAGGLVKVRPGRTGVVLQVGPTAQRMAEAIRHGSPGEIDLVATARPPDVSTEDLEQSATILSQYTTRFHPWERSRSHNVRLAAKALNGAIIRPGEMFSLNKRLGPRQPEFGYREGSAFVDGEVVPETGGGVCQVATTLYNAALRANLDVLERRHHSMPVKYVAPGLDATIYYGLIDLRLRNSVQHPIMVLAQASTDRLTVYILGRAPDKLDVQIVRDGEAAIPHGQKVIEDPTLEAGQKVVEKKGRAGRRVTVTRIARRDGEIVRAQRLHSDTYRPQDTIIKIGPTPGEGQVSQLSPPSDTEVPRREVPQVQ